jgi:ribose transport system substrate-binding protein
VRNLKKTIVIVLVAALLCALIGCANKGTSSKQEFAVLGKSVHPYWAEVEVGVKAAGKDLGVNVQFFVPQKEDSSAQLSRIKTFIASGVAGIAFAASDPNSVKGAIDDAAARDIPCVALDTDAPKTKRIAYIGTDNYGAGKIAGETLGKILGGKGNVAMCTGSLSATNSLDRMKGFTDALKKDYPGVKVITTLVDNEDSATALSKAKSAMLANPDLNAFYGVYAINGPACAKAVQSMNKVGKVRIVCFDTTAEHMGFIKSGAIDATVGQRPYMMGYDSVKFLKLVKAEGSKKALAEMKFDKDNKLDTGVDVVTKATMETYRGELKKMGIPVSGW